jgi:hypothetical protein
MYPVGAYAFACDARRIFNGPICVLADASASRTPDFDLRIDYIVQKPSDAKAWVDAISALVT